MPRLEVDYPGLDGDTEELGQYQAKAVAGAMVGERLFYVLGGLGQVVFAQLLYGALVTVLDLEEHVLCKLCTEDGGSLWHGGLVDRSEREIFFVTPTVTRLT